VGFGTPFSKADSLIQYRNSPSFVEPEHTLPLSEVSASGPCCEPDKSISHPYTPFLKEPGQYYPPKYQDLYSGQFFLCQ